MYDIIIYLLQSGACLAGFYFVYKLFLSRETLHRFNRMLLLSVIAVSAALPLCRITVERELPVAAAIPTVNITEITDVQTVTEKALDCKTILCTVFLLGMAAAVARLIFSIASLRRVIASGTTSTTDDGICLTIVGDDTKPFSWMNHIVISAKDAEEDRRIIIAHETAHIRLRHSWDIMAVDIVGCLQWFNPALWLLRRELQSLHEYEADDAVLASGINIKEYQMLLIKKAVGGRLQTIANCLNHSKLKNRITMMLQKPSSRWSAGKALLMLPLVGLSLGAFARTVYVLPQEQDKIMQNSSNIQIAEVVNSTDTLKSSVVTVRKADNGTAQSEKKVRTVVINGGNSSATDEMSVYIDGKKVEYDVLKKINPTTVESITVLKGKQAEDAGYELQSDNHSVVIVATKKGAATVDSGSTKTASPTVTPAQIGFKSEKGTIILNSKASDAVQHLDGSKIMLNGKQISAEELNSISSEIESMVVDKSSGESVIRVTTKTFDPADYSQLKNAVVCVNGKTVKTSALKTLDSSCISNVNIDKRDGKVFIRIITKDGKWLKKQKTKKK